MRRLKHKIEVVSSVTEKEDGTVITVYFKDCDIVRRTIAKKVVIYLLSGGEKVCTSSDSCRIAYRCPQEAGEHHEITEGNKVRSFPIKCEDFDAK